MKLTDEEIKKIEDNCAWWGNNCGGCETCERTFGTTLPPYDHMETFLLIQKIRELEIHHAKVCDDREAIWHQRNDLSDALKEIAAWQPGYYDNRDNQEAERLQDIAQTALKSLERKA